MVFHGDYEIEFEIYKTKDNSIESELLGHMVGLTADDAKTRWVEAHGKCDTDNSQIVAVVPLIG
jgi:hypothetical protein|tara:strand:- start:29 stop:220 length:192 start_codon:yes stop_codon:yes gene_type:complete